MKKVKKITPIKSETLCEKCKFSYKRHCRGRRCKDCEIHDEKCKCTRINNGKPCPYFERYKEEAQQ